MRTFTFEQENALTGLGQFDATPDDFRFFAELSEGKMKRKKRDAWFAANEHRESLWLVAQGILASAYGEDPP